MRITYNIVNSDLSGCKTITGSAASKLTAETLNLSANVSNYADNMSYVWYVNGDSQPTMLKFAPTGGAIKKRPQLTTV